MTFLVVLVVLFAALVLVLTIPVDVSWTLTGQRGAFVAEGRIGWLFGRWSTSLERASPRRPKRGERTRRERRGRKREPQERDRRRRASGVRRAWAALMSPGLITRVIRFAGDVVRTLEIRTLRLDATVGLDDPADTGQLWAVLGPLPFVLPALVPLRRAELHLEPAFHEETLVVDAAVDVRVVPAELLFRVGQLLFSPTTLRAAAAAVRAT